MSLSIRKSRLIAILSGVSALVSASLVGTPASAVTVVHEVLWIFEYDVTVCKEITKANGGTITVCQTYQG